MCKNSNGIDDKYQERSRRFAQTIGFTLFSVFFLLLSNVSSAQDTPIVSYIPLEGLEQFIIDRLDLTTFRNSFGPARSPGMRHFIDMDLAPSQISEGMIVFETESWFYCIEVLERKDANKDGIEDILIRFTDDSIDGSYLTVYVYLLTCFSEDSNLMALAYGPSGYNSERDPEMTEGIVVPRCEVYRSDLE